MKNKKRWALKYMLSGIGLVLAAAGALVWNGGQDKIVKSEVAVVLGNQVYLDGRPAPRLAARLDKSVELYPAGHCGTIIVSGGRGANQVDEATAMAAYLMIKGIPSSAIVIDSNGVDTWHTASFTSEYLKKNEIESVIAVTQAFHIPRTVMALRAAGCQTVGQASPDYHESRDVYSILREIPAIIVYWFKYA